jgi:hypothetical protein
VRRKLALLLGGLAAGVVVARLLRWRRHPRTPELPAPGPDPRADALRRQLAASREGTDPQPAAAPATDEAAPSSVDEARRKVHEEGRATVERMRKAEG